MFEFKISTSHNRWKGEEWNDTDSLKYKVNKLKNFFGEKVFKIKIDPVEMLFDLFASEDKELL